MIICKLTGSSRRIQIPAGISCPSVPQCLVLGSGSSRELWKPCWASGCWWQRAKLPAALEGLVGSGHGHSWERSQGKDQIRTLISPPFPREGVSGKGCPGAAAGWGECSVNLGLTPCVPFPQLLARTQRAERNRSIGAGLAPRWHPLPGEEGVYDQLFGRIDALLHTA